MRKQTPGTDLKDKEAIRKALIGNVIKSHELLKMTYRHQPESYGITQAKKEKDPLKYILDEEIQKLRGIF